MAHPYAAHRQSKVERERVRPITKNCRASGGRVGCEDADERKRGGKVEKRVHEPEGKMAKRRADRVMRAKGGKVGHKKGSTHVNVIVNGAGKEPMPIPMPPPAMAGPPPGPPVAGLGGPPPGMPPGGMPPMPPRARGGKVKKADGGDVSWDQGSGRGMLEDRKYAGMRHQTGNYTGPARAKGGKVKSGPAWEEGIKAGTQVSHRAGKASTNTPENLDRGRQITFKSGGKVKSFYARGGAVEAQGKPGKQMGPKLDGGVASGEARMDQASRAKRGYAKPMKEVDGAR